MVEHPSLAKLKWAKKKHLSNTGYDIAPLTITCHTFNLGSTLMLG